MKAYMFAVLVTLIFIAGCGSKSSPTGPVNSVGTARVSVSLKNSEVFLQLVKRAVLVISASDMKEITTEMTIADSLLTGNVASIPAGSKRHFEISVYDSDDKKQYYGESYADISFDKTTTVDIIVYRIYTGSAEVHGKLEEHVVTAGIRMVSIPAGTFQMGSDNREESPIHAVTLSAFRMSVTEITQGQYESVVGCLPQDWCNNKSFEYYFIGSNYPVSDVQWHEAALFCNILSIIEGLDICYDEANEFKCDFLKNGYRLPTEAEWEYACKAGTATIYYTGNNTSDLSLAGWYIENSGGKFHQVGQKKPNVWGLYDMHGNVYEFCNDWYGKYSDGDSTNPTGPSGNTGFHVCRGGSISSGKMNFQDIASTNRTPRNSGSACGFRIVRRP